MLDDKTKFQALMIVYHHWRFPEINLEKKLKLKKNLDFMLIQKQTSLRYQTYMLLYWGVSVVEQKTEEKDYDIFHGTPCQVCAECHKQVTRIEVLIHEQYYTTRLVCQNQDCKYIPLLSCMYFEK